jgi:hypothetical protein
MTHAAQFALAHGAALLYEANRCFHTYQTGRTCGFFYQRP